MALDLQKNLDVLEATLPDLERRRSSNPFANDVYEAAVCWLHLGGWVVEGNTKVNYPTRAKGELKLLSTLRDLLSSKSTDEQRQYGPLFQAAGDILNFVNDVEPPKDGHLGFLRIVREQFGFLQQDYGFSIVDEQPTSIQFTSDKLFVALQYSRDPWMSCSFGSEANEMNSFGVHDLLFLFGDERYRTIPQKLGMGTESDVESWFQFVAEVFRRYGRGLMQGDSTSWAQLARAQARRDEEYVQEMKMNRLYGSGEED